MQCIKFKLINLNQKINANVKFTLIVTHTHVHKHTHTADFVTENHELVLHNTFYFYEDD